MSELGGRLQGYLENEGGEGVGYGVEKHFSSLCLRSMGSLNLHVMQSIRHI